MSRETLRQLFSIVEHQVVDIRMMRDREGNLRGFGYIEYADEAGAQAGSQFTCCTSTYVQILTLKAQESRKTRACWKDAYSG